MRIFHMFSSRSVLSCGNAVLVECLLLVRPLKCTSEPVLYHSLGNGVTHVICKL